MFVVFVNLPCSNIDTEKAATKNFFFFFWVAFLKYFMYSQEVSVDHILETAVL